MLKTNIFCKASYVYGMGHLIRQIHIAKKLRSQNPEISFYIPDYQAAKDILKQNGFSFSIIPDFNSSHESGIHKPERTILDIQDTPISFIQAIKKRSEKIISFEDLGEGRNHADLLIDCNLSDAEKAPPNVKTLFGLPYSVLASEFEQAHSEKRAFPERIQTILITFGGTDPKNITLNLLKHILGMQNDFKITIIAGPGFQNRDELERLTANKPNLELVKNVQSMAQCLLKHDVVFCSGGITLHEAMCAGTPAFVINQVAHQEEKAKSAENHGAAINLGRAESWDVKRLAEILGLGGKSLQKISAAGKNLIDGKGLNRVVDTILSI